MYEWTNKNNKGKYWKEYTQENLSFAHYKGISPKSKDKKTTLNLRKQAPQKREHKDMYLPLVNTEHHTSQLEDLN